jgi:3-oxoacyl-[acyl-carrier protein] reductase
VVLLTSGQHREPMPAELPYAATKAAVQQMVPSLAAAVADRGITVNCVDPGPTDTGWADDATYHDVERRHPRHRWSTPADTAALVSWLVGPHAGWVTGQTIASDGGWGVRP